jgi:LysR family glycine cleavage system transcriptional activator
MRAPNNLNALRAFEAVARHLKLCRGSVRVECDPCRRRHLIRGLESYLGIGLFYSSASGRSRLALIDAGAALPDLQGPFDLLSTAQGH